MKILIIGASGFIGNACMDHFSQAHDTTGFDNAGMSSGRVIVAPDFLVLKQLIAQQHDVIINCAGSSDIAGSFTDTGKDFQLNVLFLQQVVEAVKTTSPLTKLINLSSAAVYGNPQTLPVKEDSQPLPLSPYGFHKLLSEQILSEYAAFSGIQALSIRIFSAYGPGLKRQFFYDLYQKFKSGQPTIELKGTGSESRDFIYISDIITALDMLMLQGDFNGGVYNVASEVESFIEPTARLCAAICGFNGELVFTQEQLQGYPINWKADIGKLRSIGFSPKTNLENGVTSYFNWIKKL